MVNEYAVLTIQKGTGNDTGTSAHIERTIIPNNVDPLLTHLNRQLIEYPEGVANRTQAIQHRLNNAGLTRKIAKKQVTVLRLLFSATPSGMKRIQEEGNLENWCNDTLEWARKEYGTNNVVAAHLHMDESTPHMHVTVVPIVTGERRKAKKEAANGKRKYKKKKANRPRLCADDLMSRDKLEHYQDSYAEAMKKYGLQRGIKGSEAKRIDTIIYYRNLVHKREEMEENIQTLSSQQQEILESLDQLQKEKKLQEVKNRLLDSLGSIFSNNPLEQLKKENKELIDQIQVKDEKILSLDKTLQDHRFRYAEEIKKHKNYIEYILDLLPDARELLNIAQTCSSMLIPSETIQQLLRKEPVKYSGNLYSTILRKKFKVADRMLQIMRQPMSREYRLHIDNEESKDWFKRSYEEYIKRNPTPKKGRGRKL